jgi:hypothetical protein
MGEKSVAVRIWQDVVSGCEGFLGCLLGQSVTTADEPISIRSEHFFDASAQIGTDIESCVVDLGLVFNTANGTVHLVKSPSLSCHPNWEGVD